MDHIILLFAMQVFVFEVFLMYICNAGFYCPEGSVNSAGTDCPPGYVVREACVQAVSVGSREVSVQEAVIGRTAYKRCTWV